MNSKLRELVQEKLNEWKGRLNKCVGYPVCDGDLVATEHEKECPEYGRSYKPLTVRA